MKRGPNVVLTSQAIDGDSKKVVNIDSFMPMELISSYILTFFLLIFYFIFNHQELAKRCIYFADLVSEDDLNRLAEATEACAERISYNHNYPQRTVILFYFDHLSSNKTICLLISCYLHVFFSFFFKMFNLSEIFNIL